MEIKKIIFFYSVVIIIFFMFFSILEKAKDIKEMAEKGMNAAKDKCKVQ